MEFVMRIAGDADLDLLVDLRTEFVAELHPRMDEETRVRMKESTHAYFNELHSKGEYVGCIGSLGDEVVCVAGILVYLLPPLVSETPRKIGHVLNFFTRPAYRRRGFAARLIEFVKETARTLGITRLVLNATPAGIPVYRNAGFLEPVDRYMYFEMERDGA